MYRNNLRFNRRNKIWRKMYNERLNLLTPDSEKHNNIIYNKISRNEVNPNEKNSNSNNEINILKNELKDMKNVMNQRDTKIDNKLSEMFDFFQKTQTQFLNTFNNTYKNENKLMLSQNSFYRIPDNNTMPTYNDIINSNRYNNNSPDKINNDNLNINRLLKNSNINSDYSKMCIKFLALVINKLINKNKYIG